MHRVRLFVVVSSFFPASKCSYDWRCQQLSSQRRYLCVILISNASRLNSKGYFNYFVTAMNCYSPLHCTCDYKYALHERRFYDIKSDFSSNSYVVAGIKKCFFFVLKLPQLRVQNLIKYIEKKKRKIF